MKLDITLEIGGGHNPSPATDVMVDKYFFDNTERGGPLKIICPTIIADGEHLPFRDKVFSRTIGRQVMEHMEDIGAFFEELMRVSSSGYLAGPSYLREQAFGWPYHKWLISEQDGVLICARKDTLTSRTGLLLHYLAAHNTHFKRFINSLPMELLHVQYQWNDHIQYRIVDHINPPALSTYEMIEGYLDALTIQSTFSKSLKQWILRWFPESTINHINQIRRVYYSVRKGRVRRAIDLDALLVCPACRQDVRKEKQGYTCKSCYRFYPIQYGVPVFLLEDNSGSTSGRLQKV